MPRGWDAKPVACPWDPSKAMTALWGGGGVPWPWLLAHAGCLTVTIN